jgi:hypothetical protein
MNGSTYLNKIPRRVSLFAHKLRYVPHNQYEFHSNSFSRSVLSLFLKTFFLLHPIFFLRFRVQTGSWANPASSKMDIRVKQPEREADH